MKPLIALLLPGSMLAQCSMCRTAAAAQGPAAMHAMNFAVLLLLAPAVVLFSGVFLLTFWCARGGGPWKKSS